MAEEEKALSKIVGVRWVGLDDMPIYLANQFVIQNVQTEFILTFGHATGPLFLTTPTKEELEKIESVDVKPLFRVGMTADRLIELIGILEMNLRKYQNKQMES